MTGLLICEDCCLDRPFTVPPEAVGIEGSSLYLQAGETLCLEELLYGMMLQSGNDAAVALAIAHSGSVEAFVARMNERAQALGLCSTHFANPHGLDDDGNFSTAADLARLACAAMDNTAFARIVSTKSCRFGARSFTNHNKLLWRLDGAEGVKTGYTKAAGRILVSSARRRGRRLVCVTIHAPDDWNDHCALLEAGFSRFQSAALCEKGQILGARTGADGSVCALLAADRSITAYLLPGEYVSRISVFCSAGGEHYAAFYSGEQQLACCPLAEIGVTNG